MASISASGIACAALTVGLALLRAAQPIEAAPAQAGTATLEIAIRGARSDKGLVRIAVCPPASGFPDCADAAVRSASLALAGGSASVTFTGIVPGRYAVSAFHDANGNGRLDSFLGIPREGFGFSRNPPVRPRAPRFEEAALMLTERNEVDIALKYIF